MSVNEEHTPRARRSDISPRVLVRRAREARFREWCAALDAFTKYRDTLMCSLVQRSPADVAKLRTLLQVANDIANRYRWKRCK